MSFLSNLQQQMGNAPAFDLSKMPVFNPPQTESPKESAEEAKKRTEEAINNFANNLKNKMASVDNQQSGDKIDDIVPEKTDEADVAEPVPEKAEEPVEAPATESVSAEPVAPEPAPEEASTDEPVAESESTPESETTEEIPKGEAPAVVDKQAEEPQTEETKEEEKPKKSKKKSSKKKAEKDEPQVEQPVLPPGQYIVDVNKKPDYKTADDWMKSYYFESKFIEMLTYFSDKISNIRIEGDMNAGTLKAVLGEIDSVMDELSVQLDSAIISNSIFNNKDNGLVAQISSQATGKNSEERRRETLELLKNAVIDNVPVDLDYMAVSSSMRCQALDGLMKRLAAKKSICVTMSAGLKLQNNV